MNQTLITARCPECDVHNFVVDLAPKGLVLLVHDRETPDGLRMCPGSDAGVYPEDVRPFATT